MPFIVNKLKSGDILEQFKVFSLKTPGKKNQRAKNQNPSPETQKEKNYRNSVNQLSRKINTNFGEGDIFATLSYKDANLPLTLEQIKRDFKNYIKRINRYLKKNTLPNARYIAIIEHKEQRANIHIVISGIDLDQMERLWGKGWVNIKRLHTGADFKGIAKYMTKEQKEKNEKMWIPSTNLKKPEVEKRIVKATYELRTPKGYIKISSEIYPTEFGLFEYAKYIRVGGFDYFTGSSAPLAENTKAIAAAMETARMERSNDNIKKIPTIPANNKNICSSCFYASQHGECMHTRSEHYRFVCLLPECQYYAQG